MANDISGTITVKIIAPGLTRDEGGGGDVGQQIARQIKQIGGERFLPFSPPPMKIPRSMWPAGMFGTGGFSTQQTSQREEKEEEKIIKKREAEYTRNLRDQALITNRIQKEQGNLSSPAMKSLSRYLPIMAGMAGIAGILKYSKIISEMTSAVGSILGAYIDLFLLNFVPVMVDILKILSTGIKIIQDPVGTAEDLGKVIVENVASTFNKLINEVRIAIPEYGLTFAQKVTDLALTKKEMPSEMMLVAAGLESEAENIYYLIQEAKKTGREMGLTSEEIRRQNEQTKQIAKTPIPIVAQVTPTFQDPVREARIRLAREKEFEEYETAVKNRIFGFVPTPKEFWEAGDMLLKRITGNYNIDVNIDLRGNPFASPEEIAAKTKLAIQSALDEAEKRGQ